MRCERKDCWVATGVLTVALSTLIFRLWPSFPLVALAEVLQGVTGGVLGPAVIAITLGLVGHAALAERLGQNQRFAAAGGVVVTLSIDGYDGHADTAHARWGWGWGLGAFALGAFVGAALARPAYAYGYYPGYSYGHGYLA